MKVVVLGSVSGRLAESPVWLAPAFLSCVGVVSGLGWLRAGSSRFLRQRFIIASDCFGRRLSRRNKEESPVLTASPKFGDFAAYSFMAAHFGRYLANTE